MEHLSMDSVSRVDNGDTFATHFCLGIIATISTGLFGLKEVAAYDGVSEIAGGVFFDGHVGQVGIQLVEAVIGITYSFTMSYLIMCLIDSVPGFEVLAVDEEGMCFLKQRTEIPLLMSTNSYEGNGLYNG